ncbi:MAG TPA: HAD-IIIC family phosphatase [Jatrophihabitans sp.]|nr:HAD-IIIC family phosphatase [Jatrophihabitans sp.]
MDTVKCLIWDLDETLWRGVILEDQQVTVSEEIREVIAELDRRGILQSVASRNDHDQAWAWLEKLGLAEYFVFPRIGWNRKSDSVREIADKLGFVHHTIAFIDDQPAERAEVAHYLPGVRCYSAEQALELPSRAEFTPATINVESRLRRSLYQAQERRAAQQAVFAGTDEEFLRTLDLRLDIRRATGDDVGRVEELTLRTSQMNATGVHYSDADLRALLASRSHEVLVASLEDRFGSHGAIGIVLLEKHPGTWHLKLLATSCRVVKFGVGAVLLRWLSNQAALAAAHLVADFRRTDRNRIMEIAYRFAGFTDDRCPCREALAANDDVARLHLTATTQPLPTTLRVDAPTLTDLTLHDWFTRTVERTPDAVALEVFGRALTYRELDACATQVASAVLSAHGGRPARVALLASRSLVAFAGYLAIVRLGASVIPLNPGYPMPHNQRIADTAGFDALIADETGAAQTRAGLGRGASTVVCLTDASLTGHAGPSGDIVAPPGLDDVAYILFTSGSTGRPKGVPIKHRNLSPYIAYNIDRYRVGPGCRTSHTFDLTFDPSIFDLFVTWGGGATLVCPQRSELLSPVSYLVDGGITHWFSVPSVISVSANLGNLPAGLGTNVRHSIFIGEQLSLRQAARWKAAVPESTIDNVYGPTELTVACTDYRLPDDPAQWPTVSNDTVPVGSVYTFLDAAIVDESGQAAAEGELCVRGSQRFDGYLDPRDDAGRFYVIDADGRFVSATGAEPVAYYRTGDRVRREQNQLVHLGRLDSQVKISGYRVELGEIETALARYQGIAQAIVIVRPHGDEARLTALYSGEPVDERALVRWLRARLPMHMVPREYRYLAAMPLNPNGKIDRSALRDRQFAAADALPAAGG